MCDYADPAHNYYDADYSSSGTWHFYHVYYIVGSVGAFVFVATCVGIRFAVVRAHQRRATRGTSNAMGTYPTGRNQRRNTVSVATVMRPPPYSTATGHTGGQAAAAGGSGIAVHMQQQPGLPNVPPPPYPGAQTAPPQPAPYPTMPTTTSMDYHNNNNLAYPPPPPQPAIPAVLLTNTPAGPPPQYTPPAAHTYPPPVQ